MAFSISARAFKGLAIGALEEEKRHRLAAETRVDEQVKFDRANDAAKEAAALQEEGLMARQKYGSDKSYDAQIRSSQIAGRSRVAAASATALTKERENYFDFNAKKFGITLPQHYKLDLKAKPKSPSMYTFAQLNSAYVYMRKQIDGFDLNDPQRKATMQSLNENFDELTSRYMVSTNPFQPIKDITGNEVYSGDFDFESAAKQLNEHIESSGKNAFPKSWMGRQQPDPDSVALRDEVVTFKNQNSNTSLAKALNRVPNGVANSMWVTLSTSGDPASIYKSGIFQSMIGTDEEKLVAVNKIKKSKAGFAFNYYKPRRHLDAIAQAAAYQVQITQQKPQAFAGRKFKNTKLPKDDAERIKTNRKIHAQNRGMLSDTTKLLQLNEELTDYGSYSLNAFRNIALTAKSIIIGTSDNPLSYNDTDKEDMDRVSRGMGIFKDSKGSYFEELRKAANSRLNRRRTFIFGQENITEKEKQAQYESEVQYEALKIQLVYKTAKLIQGGSGGQAVSNADFVAVLKSMRAGPLGNLPAERAIFTLLRKMVEREYVYSSIMSNPSLKSGYRDAVDMGLDFMEVFHEDTTRGQEMDLHTDGFPVEDDPRFRKLPSLAQMYITEQRFMNLPLDSERMKKLMGSE